MKSKTFLLNMLTARMVLKDKVRMIEDKTVLETDLAFPPLRWH